MQVRKNNRPPIALLLLFALLLGLAGCNKTGGWVGEFFGTQDSTVPTTTFAENPIDYPVFEDLAALRDYLYACIQNGNYAPRFCYKGTGQEITPQNLARMLSAYYITLRGITGRENCWQMNYTPYPGDRIVEAYRIGDSSALTDDEREALGVAMDVVAQAKEHSGNALGMELYLHDWLCDQVTYYGGSTQVSNEQDILRHLTALGALLDGKANCQGYTDGFYVLASIAGFDVGRQSCVTKDGGHAFNTIRIDGKWYVVDLTFNDDTYRNGNELYRDYRLFNAGIDLCAEYTWPEEYQYYPLQKESGEVYYYHLTEALSPDHGYEKRFDSTEAIADAVVRIRQTGDRKEIHMMLSGEHAKWSDLHLEDKLSLHGMKQPVAVWSAVCGDNTYFYIRFE